ncbi:hypothetical protein [Burkholderia diffusa]|uniref:HEPN domain-containing protein n=1 Tax=Burkholderia diffusa TaxID=488732 RepID=A0A6P2R2G2_9BURK|nr:hypothetical protein [Burkholderia diffusa]KAB0650289.1 hypothetical protein F7R23_24645 [Burkholderia diffusa]MBM2657016.1 hypothetical protein [Burkholderia diffusa]VWC29122.1 hypothetical protein BDI24065_06283 [Burkholderia diffusa]
MTKDEDERTTAVGLARYAYEYIAAARLVDSDHAEKHAGEQISPVTAYFLVYHGIELTLKAYLRHTGVTVRVLRSAKYGHDLHACYRKAKEEGLLDIFNETPDDRSAMQMLVGLNVGHGLRYIQTGMKQFPVWSIVEPLAVRLHQAVAHLVGYRSFLVA